jgi:preprotein translocase subunit YajC
MKFEITFEHLIMLVAILYILMFVIKTKERFDQAQEKQEEKKQKIDKACSQQSINYGYLHYVFNSPAVPRK